MKSKGICRQDQVYSLYSIYRVYILYIVFKPLNDSYLHNDYPRFTFKEYQRMDVKVTYMLTYSVQSTVECTTMIISFKGWVPNP